MKNMKKWLSLSLAGAMLMGVLAGCGGGTSSTPAPAETGAAEATGEPAAVEQVLKYGTDTWPAGFDPHTISAIAATRVFNQVYETLIDFNPDMTFKGVLAESNRQFVERAARAIREFGCEVATPDEARQILSLTK